MAPPELLGILPKQPEGGAGEKARQDAHSRGMGPEERPGTGFATSYSLKLFNGETECGHIICLELPGDGQGVVRIYAADGPRVPGG